MRRLAAIACVGLLLACQGATKADGPAKYRAWCWTKSRPLGDWTFDRAAAEEELKKHDRIFPHHSATIKVFRTQAEK